VENIINKFFFRKNLASKLEQQALLKETFGVAKICKNDATP